MRKKPAVFHFVQGTWTGSSHQSLIGYRYRIWRKASQIIELSLLSGNKRIECLSFIYFSKHILKWHQNLYCQMWYWGHVLGSHCSGLTFLSFWVWVCSWNLHTQALLCWHLVHFFLPKSFSSMLHYPCLILFCQIMIAKLFYFQLPMEIQLVFDFSIDSFLFFSIWTDLCKTSEQSYVLRNPMTTLKLSLSQKLGDFKTFSNWLFSFPWHFSLCLYLHKGKKEIIWTYNLISLILAKFKTSALS